MKRVIICLFSLSLLGAIVAGCGSGGGVPKETVATTPLRLQINWPARSRQANIVAPGSAQSVVLTLKRTGTGETLVTFPTIDRQEGAGAYTQNYASPTGVLPGSVNLTARFLAEKNGQGAEVAQANKAFVLDSTGNGAGAIVLQGKVQKAEIVAGQKVNVGEKLSLAVTARDSNNAAVALSRGSLSFSLVSGGDVLGITPDGEVTGKAIGSGTVRVTVDGITSETQTVNVQVANLKVSVPEQQSVTVGETKALSVTITDNNDAPVSASAGAISYSIVSGSDKLSLATNGQMTGLATGFAVVKATVSGVASVNQTVFIGNIQTTATGLKYFDGATGTGDILTKNGDKLSMQYTGTLLNGTEFDSSRRPGRTPFDFTLGGNVIAGWNEGLQGIKPGTRRYLIIPSALGYGTTGSGTTIPPNATLLFDTELLEIKP
jgi:peptidylprolyl isomerase